MAFPSMNQYHWISKKIDWLWFGMVSVAFVWCITSEHCLRMFSSSIWLPLIYCPLFGYRIQDVINRQWCHQPAIISSFRQTHIVSDGFSGTGLSVTSVASSDLLVEVVLSIMFQDLKKSYLFIPIYLIVNHTLYLLVKIVTMSNILAIFILKGDK